MDRRKMNSNSAVRAQDEIVSLASLVVGVSFAAYSVVIFLPSEIFLSNLNEFSLRLADLIKILLPTWVIAILFGVAILAAVPSQFRFRVLSIVYSIGLLFWIQGSFLVWDYGSLDGSDIDWSRYWKFGLLDSAIWFLVLAIAIAVPRRMLRVGRTVAVLTMTIQSLLLILVGISGQSSDDEASKRNFSIDYSNKYEFSVDQNVLFIVLDAFQSDVFEEIVSTEAGIANAFRGFTYFPDAVAGGNYTELAIPALLTGKTYDNSVVREEFLADAFLNHGLTTKLKTHGYHVELYPWVGWGNESIYFDERIASNLIRNEVDEDRGSTFTEKNAKETLHLLDLALFRAVPHFFKKIVHNDHKWFFSYFVSYMVPDNIKQTISTDNEYEVGTFVKRTPSVINTSRTEPVFKYFHFKGAHSPLSVNSNLEFTSQVFPFGRQNYINQAKANLIGLQEFFERLRIAGVYDDMLILIVGDHGSGDSAEMYIEPPGSSRESYRLDGTDRNFRRDKARAIPLVLLKRRGKDGPLETSQVPVALTDIPVTVLSELGFSDDLVGGVSIFEIDPELPRVRFHGAFEFSPNKQIYVDEITLYRIEGDSWSNESWSVDAILGGKQIDNDN